MKTTAEFSQYYDRNTPNQDEIAALAYHIYQKEGCPSGRSGAHWREAERHLRSCNESSDLPMPTFSGNGDTPARRDVVSPPTPKKNQKRRSMG